MRKVRSNEKTKNGLLASPSGRVNDISMEDNTEIKDGLISPIKGSKRLKYVRSNYMYGSLIYMQFVKI
ncbi:hypothetical protein IC582_018932 [Cucumis melo]